MAGKRVTQSLIEFIAAPAGLCNSLCCLYASNPPCKKHHIISYKHQAKHEFLKTRTGEKGN